MSLFARLNEAATQAGLRFIVIGGHAVISHGYQRGTEDADILVDKTDRPRWQALVEELGFRFKHDGGAFLQFTSPDPKWWDLDLMLVPAATFQQLLNDVRPAQIEGAAMLVPSLQHLLALKLHALKHTRGLRGLKDMDDVAHLLLDNGVDVRAEWVRQLFEKHGTPEHYERILRFTAP